MSRCTYLLVLGVLAAGAAAAPASGVLGGRKAPANPGERVQQLVVTVQAAQDETERTEAVAALREFDAGVHPSVVPALVSALRTDKAVGVRIEAARSLGRVRPLTGMARDALFEASLHDSAFRVRWQARTSLTYYTVANVNPHNHVSSQPVSVKGGAVAKEQGMTGSSATPKAGSGSYAIPSTRPVFAAPSPGSVGYSRPLPKGPTQSGILMPTSNAPGPILQSTREPPLAPVISPAVPAQKTPIAVPNLNPLTPTWVPAKAPNLPTIPVVPATNPTLPTVPPVLGTPPGAPGTPPAPVPTEGPILAPPP